MTMTALCLVSGAVTGAAQERTPARSIHILDSAGPVPAKTPPPSLPTDEDASAASNNPAGVRIEIRPRSEVRLGERLAFEVSAKKQGFLILLDVDAEGKLKQIYPNALTLSNPNGVDADANRIMPRRPVTVPESDGTARYEFVAAPPLGVGMIVAILSDDPLQIVDLPDVPAALVGNKAAIDFLRENSKSLKIVPIEASSPPRAPKWSFAAKFYAVR